MVKKFKFRLERVLEYREALKNEKKKELLIKNKALREAEDKLQALQHELLNRGAISAGNMAAQDLHLRNDYELRLKTEIEHTLEKIQILTIEADKAKEEYIEAVKEYEALKVLKERKLVEYNELVDKADAKYLDEFAVQRAGRELLKGK